MLSFDPLSVRVKVIGVPIGEMGKPMIDADNDGKCRERGGKFVPCPPGVRAGSIIRKGKPVRKTRFDLREGGGIDHTSLISEKHRKKMTDRLEGMGLTEDQLRDELRKGMDGADKSTIRQARKWYPNLNKKMKELTADLNSKHGTSLKESQIAGVIAVISPAREFKKNVRDAKKLLAAVAEDKEFEITDDILKKFRKNREQLQAIIDRTDGPLRPSSFKNDELDILAAVHPTISTLSNSTGLAPVIKALQITRGADPDKIISGPKVRSFYSNIIDPKGERVTIDTWMYRIMVPPDAKIKFRNKELTLKEWEKEIIGYNKAGDPVTMRTQDLFQSGLVSKEEGIPPNVGLYPVFAQAIRDIALEYGIPPADVQAILWEVARTRAGYKITSWEDVAKEFAL